MSPAIKHIDEERLQTDLEYRFGYLAEFIGFGEDDVNIILACAEHLAPVADALVDAVYDKLFSYDCTKRHFVPRQSGYEGELPETLDALTLEHDVIAFRKSHLKNYLVKLVTGPYDGNMLSYLNRVGGIHTPQMGSKELDVPLVQMNALMGFVADAVNATILSLDVDADTKGKALRAFSKLLWIQNDLINKHYVPELQSAG